MEAPGYGRLLRERQPAAERGPRSPRFVLLLVRPHQQQDLPRRVRFVLAGSDEGENHLLAVQWMHPLLSRVPYELAAMRKERWSVCDHRSGFRRGECWRDRDVCTVRITPVRNY